MNANSVRRTTRKLVQVIMENSKPETKRGRLSKVKVSGEVVPFPVQMPAAAAARTDVPVMTHDGQRLLDAFHRLSARRRKSLLAAVEAEATITK